MVDSRLVTRGVLGALLLAAASACTSSTDSAGGDLPWEGFWRLTVDVTVATGACVGEEDEPASLRDVLITEEAGVVTATAMWTDESGSVSLTGGVFGDSITFGGSYAEDGGTTTALYTLEVSETSLSGREDWSWTGIGGSCPGSQSTVTGVPR